MFEFHEKRKLKKFLYSKGFLVFMCIPLGFMSYAAYHAYEKEQQTSMQRQELTEKLDILDQRAQDLEKKIERLEDPRGIEAELRSRYDVGWEGEEIIVLVEESESSTWATSSNSEEVPSLWQRFLKMIF